jgi:hypothetical protein
MSKKDELMKDMPFGRPFASQMSSKEIVDSYFEMPNMNFSLYSGSFAYTSRRGGGKTHLLRKMYAEFVDSREFHESLLRYEGASFSTEYVLDSVRKYNVHELQYHLKNIWEMVLAIRIAGIFYDAIKEGMLNLERRNEKEALNELEKWVENAGMTIGISKSTAAIYNKLINIFSRRHYGEKDFLHHFNRREFIAFLKGINLTAYLLIDDTDDSYHESPSFWDINLACLYETIMFFRKELPKFHIVIAMRREVYDFIQHNNPNWTRIAGRDNVKDIVWSNDLLKLFFEKKMSKLPRSFFLSDNVGDNLIYKFLGTNTIKNMMVQGGEEDTFKYILRHTFYRARDFIYMGNEIWSKIKGLEGKNSSNFLSAATQEKVRQGVALAAKALAEEIISECDAVIRDFARIILPWQNPSLYLLCSLKKNVISKFEFHEVLVKIQNECPELAPSFLYNILAKWGLIGWASRTEYKHIKIQRFNFATSPNEPKIRELPDSDFYFLHPSLAHIEEINVSVDFNSEVIVGHEYEFQISVEPHQIVVRPPFQLNWVEPHLIDSSKNVIPIPDSYHAILKGLFELKDIQIISDLFVVRAMDLAAGTINHQEYDSDYIEKQARQFARYLRKILKKYGINDRNSIIRNVRGKGYTKGNDWHPKRPTINQSSPPLFRTDKELY